MISDREITRIAMHEHESLPVHHQGDLIIDLYTPVELPGNLDQLPFNVIKLRPDRFPEVAFQAGFGLIRCGCMLKSDPDNLSGLG